MDNRRYYGLDALRGGMMMLGIVLHGVGFYIAAPPATLPVPTDHNTSYAADLIFHFIHSFRMPTFFLLAGFFASLLLEKRGMWGMYKDRVARIVAPMLAAIVVILPPMMLFVLDFMLSVRFGTHDLLPDRAALEQLGKEMRAAGFPVEEPSIGHLWFLYYLCYFYLLVPLCRLLVDWSRPFEARITRWVASPAAFAFFGFYTAATLWPFHGGQVHEGFIFLKPHLPSLVYYGSFFVFGFLFHHHRAVLQALARFTSVSAALAAVLFPASLYLSFLENSTNAPTFGDHLAAVVAHGFCTWAIIYAFVGGALRLFDRESPWVLYASQSAYWVYLVHMPFVCLAAWLLVPYDIHAMVKALAVMAFTTVGCFVSYHYLVQRTWVSRFLNGKRFDLDWPWRYSAPRGSLKLADDETLPRRQP